MIHASLSFQIFPPETLHTVVKMASQVEKAECVLWFDEPSAAVAVFGREPAT
jgi:hypothetical protein